MKVTKLSLNNHDITVIIPAYNEEKTIGQTINALNRLALIDKILVVDDGSNDKTSIVVRSLGAEILRLESNQGKAYAMKKGYELSTSSIIVFLDADLGSSAEDSIKLIEPICYDKADVTIAIFSPTPGKGGFGLVKKLSTWGLRFLTGKSYKTVLSGQRAFKRSLLSPDSFKYQRFGIEFGMMVDLIKSDLRIAEVEVDMVHRTSTRDFKGFVHRGKQFKDILKVIISKLSQMLIFNTQ